MPEATIVTSENLQEFNRARLGILSAEKPPEKPIEAKKEEKTEEEEHKKPPIAQRFSDLTAARKEAERREQEAVAKLRAAEEKLAEIEKKPNEKPDQSKYTDAFKYAEDLADWKVGERLKERDEADRKARIQAETERVGREWNSKIRKAEREIDDYHEIVDPANLSITRELTMALLESDIGPWIQYHLAKNPDELDRLKEMSPTRMFKAFGLLEDHLEKELKRARESVKTDIKSIETVKPVKKVQEPPEPITPLKSSGGIGDASVVDANGHVTGSFKDYKRARRAGKI